MPVAAPERSPGRGSRAAGYGATWGLYRTAPSQGRGSTHTGSREPRRNHVAGTTSAKRGSPPCTVIQGGTMFAEPGNWFVTVERGGTRFPSRHGNRRRPPATTRRLQRRARRSGRNCRSPVTHFAQALESAHRSSPPPTAEIFSRREREITCVATAGAADFGHRIRNARPPPSAPPLAPPTRSPLPVGSSTGLDPSIPPPRPARPRGCLDCRSARLISTLNRTSTPPRTVPAVSQMPLWGRLTASRRGERRILRRSGADDLSRRVLRHPGGSPLAPGRTCAGLDHGRIAPTCGP